MTTLRPNRFNDVAFDCLTAWRRNGLNIEAQIAHMGVLIPYFMRIREAMQNPGYIHRRMGDRNSTQAEDNPVSNVLRIEPPSYENSGIPPRYEDVPPPMYEIAILSPPAYCF